jgi:hypothetical protein
MKLVNPTSSTTADQSSGVDVTHRLYIKLVQQTSHRLCVMQMKLTFHTFTWKVSRGIACITWKVSRDYSHT